MRTPDELEELAQQFSLAHHLTEWDQTLTYNEVLDILNEDAQWDDDRVLVWATYEGWHGASIANAIGDLTLTTLDLLMKVAG